MKYKVISYGCILGIICICSFLVAKFIIRNSIYGETIPVDTSHVIE